MEGLIVEEPGTEPIATAAMPDSDEERQLADEIVELWAVHVEAKGVANKTRTELKAIRERLSGRLYEMKQLLARPGRNGQWSAWLKERKLSRATADRLVQRFAAATPSGESTHESIEDVEKLAKSVWQRVQKVLSTDEAVVAFIASLADLAGLECEQRQDGLLISEAVEQAADEVPDFVSVSESAMQPSSEVAPIADQVVEQAAAAADAGIGATA